MNAYEQLARRYCALVGEDPDERIEGVPVWRLALGDLEAAMNALDTFGLETRTTFHQISETAQAERPRRAFTLIRRVA
jgi:hypothetical protein